MGRRAMGRDWRDKSAVAGLAYLIADLRLQKTGLGPCRPLRPRAESWQIDFMASHRSKCSISIASTARAPTVPQHRTKQCDSTLPLRRKVHSDSTRISRLSRGLAVCRSQQPGVRLAGTVTLLSIASVYHYTCWVLVQERGDVMKRKGW
jgi:hypothetical protein